MVKSIDEYRAFFTSFYDELTEVHKEQFEDGAPCRIGSTYRVPGAGGLDAQTFYMSHVLDFVFEDKTVVADLVSLARAAYNGDDPPADAAARVACVPELHERLYRATEAASSLTAKIGRWKEGTDLFANILTNADCSLQLAGIYDHTVEKRDHGGGATTTGGTMDQSAIDALFD